MSTSLRCTNWNEPIGLPNCTRDFAWSRAASKHARPAPTVPHAMPNRASVRHDSGPLMPSIPGKAASDGRRTSRSNSSERAAARKDQALSSWRNSTPGVVDGTTNPRMTPVSSLAHTIATSLTHPFVFHFLCPSRIQSLPSRRAVWSCSRDPNRSRAR